VSDLSVVQPDLPVEVPAAAAPRVEWDLSAAPPAPAPPQLVERAKPAPPAEPMSLAAVFSALLAAERSNTDSQPPARATAALSEAHVEEVVQRVVSRMTDELVRKIVLETAERLIREEIDKIKS